MALPDLQTPDTAPQSRRQAVGGMPADSASRKVTAGALSRAVPVLSFRLLPPPGAEGRKVAVNVNCQPPVVQPSPPLLLCPESAHTCWWDF